MAGQVESVDLARPAPPCLIFVSAGWESLDNGAGLTSVAPNLSVVGGTIEK